MKRFFGFAIADSMFESVDSVLIYRTRLSVEETRMVLSEPFTSCLNPSHAATIAAMRSRFNIDAPIPETPPKVSLGVGDSLVVMGVRGLPRLTDRHEYTEAEIASAMFTFSLYVVGSPTSQ